MKGPVLEKIEFRSFIRDTIKYVNKKTGKSESFLKQVLRCEADDGTPISISVRSPDDEPIDVTLKKGDLFTVELTSFQVDKGNVEAGCMAQDFKKVA